VDIAEELKRKSVVIQAYEPGYAATESRATVRRRKGDGTDGISALFKDFDRRSFTLRTLRQAGRPITTGECALAFAREVGLEQDDRRMGKIGNRFSQVLDQLAKTNRVRRAGTTENHRHLWEING
jgi:hypothetical protein